jgi:hypothetical protein
VVLRRVLSRGYFDLVGHIVPPLNKNRKFESGFVKPAAGILVEFASSARYRLNPPEIATPHY